MFLFTWISSPVYIFSYLLSLGSLKPPHIFYYSFRADEYKIDILSYNSYAS